MNLWFVRWESFSNYLSVPLNQSIARRDQALRNNVVHEGQHPCLFDQEKSCLPPLPSRCWRAVRRRRQEIATRQSLVSPTTPNAAASARRLARKAKTAASTTTGPIHGRSEVGRSGSKGIGRAAPIALLPYCLTPHRDGPQVWRDAMRLVWMVGVTGIEPVTPAMSMQCSPA